MKKLVRAAFRSIGLDLIRFDASSSNRAALQRMLDSHAIDLVLDVGANTGQYGVELRSAGYRGQIVSFEPLATAHRELLGNSKKYEHWHVHSPLALGAEFREVQLNVSGNSVSSSILPMLESHISAAPESAYVSTEWCKMDRLDSVSGPYLDGKQHAFLKLDVQGYEMEVLRGAEQILHQICGIQMEISLQPLYADQPTIGAVLEHMHNNGFQLWSVFPGFCDRGSGRLLQLDGVFFRDVC